MDIQNFFFYDSQFDNDLSDSMVGIVPENISTATQLLQVIGRILKFPGYYGENWNALYDCLRDFHWCDRKNIVLVHGLLPGLAEEELRIYLGILESATIDWAEDPSHKLIVFFKSTEKQKLLVL